MRAIARLSFFVLLTLARGARAADDVAEVTVRGDAADPGGTTLRQGEVRQIPGTFGDPLRALELVPGATPLANGAPYYLVRGAPPSGSGYFIDGVRVPLLYHVGFGPSVLPASLLDHVDYYPGAYPANFGRLIGGVVAATTRDPLDRAHGEAQLRVFDVGAVVEAPVGSDLTALAGGRYSYTGGILALTGADTQFSYWDYQARVAWTVTPRDRVTVFAFGSFDDLSDKGGVISSDATALSTEFHRIDTRYDRALGSHGTLRAAITLGSDRTHNTDDATIRDLMGGARVELDDILSKEVRLRAGADVIVDRYSLDPSADADPKNLLFLGNLYPPRTDATFGVHADVVLRPTDRVEIVPGVRGDMYQTGGGPTRPAVDPRLTARVRVAPSVFAVSGIGLMHQPAAFFIPLPGLDVTSAHHGLQTSAQMSQGIEVQMPEAVMLRATAFLHEYLDLSDISTTCPVLNLSDPLGRCVDERVRGRSFGGELLVRRGFTKRLTGWLSYTLSRTTREMPSFQDPSHVSTVPNLYDRTHVLNAAAAYSLGAGWRAAARLYAYSGRPYSDQTDIPVPPYNVHRFAGFARIDLRVEKRWRVGERASLAVVAEWMNATLSREETQLQCVRTDTLHDRPQTLDRCAVKRSAPVTVPSLGVEAAF